MEGGVICGASSPRPAAVLDGSLDVLMLLVVTLISIGDTRQILGINPWIKPMKFMISIAIFLWTVAWFMPDTRQPETGFSRIDRVRSCAGPSPRR